MQFVRNLHAVNFSECHKHKTPWTPLRENGHEIMPVLLKPKILIVGYVYLLW